MTAKEYAEQTLEYLEDCGIYKGTTDILYHLKATSARQHVLKVLHRLNAAGLLYVTGQGKFEWKLKDYDWRDKLAELKLRGGGGHKGNGVASSQVLELQNKLSQLTQRLTLVEQTKAVVSGKPQTIEVKHYDGKVVELKDCVLPSQFATILDLARCRRNILMVGPAGCGKTKTAELVAKSLDLRFSALVCTEEMTTQMLFGKSTPNITTGKSLFQGADFLDLFENGGLFLLDEIDAANPNTLLALNTGLANGFLPVVNRPEKTHAVRHKDFICAASANTFGRGANRVYQGRNQLDESSIDRFRIGTVECYYDAAVEAKVCPVAWLREALQSLRKRIEDSGLRRICSTRYLEDAYIMHKEAGWDLHKILSVFLQGWSKEEKLKLGSTYQDFLN